MKAFTILFCTLVATAATVSAQFISTEQVPLQVHHAFLKRFPEVQKETWATENKKEYLVNFVMYDTKYNSVFSSEGQWRKTEKMVSSIGLPKNVSNIVSQKYPGYKITAAYQVSTYDRKDKFYQLEIWSDTVIYELQVSAEGTLLKETKVARQ